jgi:PAS domain S-box-containing protein
MPKTDSASSDRRVSIGPGGRAEAPGDRSPAAHTHRGRVLEVATLSAGVAGATLVLEAAKQWLHPDISAWESHAITVLFVTVAAAVAGAVVLRWRDTLHARVVAEADQHRRAADDAARANALLLATLDSNRDGVLVVGLDDTVLTYNRQFVDMWHLPEQMLRGLSSDMLPHTLPQLSNPDVLAATVSHQRTDVESESSGVLEFKDGRTIELFAAPQRLDGVTVGRVWRCRDVTSHRQAERHIQMLAHTLRSVGECVSVTDMDDRLIYVNPAFLRTYGFEQSGLLGRSVAELRSERTSQEVAREILPATLQGGWRGELWNRKKDGTDFQIFLSTSIVRDEAGAPVALVGVARDITEQKRTEEALIRGRESERIVTLAAGIAHEFNNLLQTVLAGTAFGLEDLPPESGARDSLQMVLHAGERAANLTAQLLAYAGRGAFVHVVAFDLNDEIREQAAFLSALMPIGATLGLDLASGGAPVRADRQQIRQVLTSLVTNAAEAMTHQEGRVSVRTRVEQIDASDSRPWIVTEHLRPGPYACLSVEDQGTGIDAATISRIFDPFFSTKFQGRGMGLAAVLGVARATEGAVSVASTPGHGTTVTVAFPCGRIET